MSKLRQRLKAFGRVVLLIVISLIIGTSVYSFNAKTLMGNAMPMPFGFGISVVLSGSMEPTLSVDDLVLVKKAKTYEVGDVVVYQHDSSLIIHRIKSINGDTVITKGDANNAADSPINISSVKGKAIGHLPYVGAAALFLKSPVGTAVLVIALIVLFELPYLYRRKQAEAEKEKIKEEIRKLKGE